MMQTISYLLLDAFVVFLVIALFGAVLKKCVFFFKLIKQLKKKSFRLRPCATLIVEKPESQFKAETKILTPFPEPRDWSQYETPAYLRKGIFIH